MIARSNTRRIGDTCKRGHLITHENAYRDHHGSIRCAQCILDLATDRRRRKGVKSRQITPRVEDPQRCSRCAKRKPLQSFGRSGTYADGTPKYHAWCPMCRSAKQRKQERSEVQSRRHECNELRQFIVASGDRLLANGWSLNAVLRAFRISPTQWYGWRSGERAISPTIVGRVVEQVRQVLVKEKLL